MYSTCIHCHAALGRNDAVEHFPIGQRLAFDAEKGRLWAVCRGCGRWNLSPLEERWEAIEQAERLFRDTRLRVSTENIGLARAADGTELVRVGRPQRPEFAAWRYGDAMGLRRRRALLKVGAGVTLTGAAVAAGVATGIATGIGAILLPVAGHLGVLGVNVYAGVRNYMRATRVPVGDGRVHAVYGANLKETGLRPAEGGAGWRLSLRWAGGFEAVQGDAARTALGVLLPRVNALGAKPERVRLASRTLADAGGPDAFLADLARRSEALSAGYLERRAAHRRGDNLSKTISPFDRNYDWLREPVDHGALPRLDPVQRLALEMAVHEETERRALEGELAALEAAWREAEEIAGIADRLALPEGVEERLEQIKRGG